MLLMEIKSGTLISSKEEVEAFPLETFNEDFRNEGSVVNSNVRRAKISINSTWNEVEQVVKKVG